MEILLPYGRQKIPININDKNVVAIVEPSLPIEIDWVAEIKRALNNPIASPVLPKLVQSKKPETIVILTTDISRPIPYQVLLNNLINQLLAGGAKRKQITMLIATGAHRANKDQEIKEVFGSLADQYDFINHNCDQDLIELDTLQNGTPLLVNKLVAQADLVITTGCIMPHNLAGFSGGPKLILPGVAGRKTIEQNHSLMLGQQVGPGAIKNNPIHQQILAAAKRVGVDFNCSVLLNESNQIIKCFAGGLEESWLAGCQYCHDLYSQELPAAEEVVIAGTGGYPRDINLYQAVKALINGAKLVRPGGTLVLVGQCEEGMGEPLFKDWMHRTSTPEALVNDFLTEGFRLGAHKAYIICNELKNKEVILISDFAKSGNQVPLLQNARDWREAEKIILQKHGPDYRALILPFGGLVFPLSGQPMPSLK